MLLERLRTGIGRGNEPKPVTIKDLQRDLPVYGPAVPLTLEEVARRARQDPMPLRGPEGGYYGADRHPGILARQLREFEEAFGTTDDRELPRWLVWTGLAVMVLVLGGLGYFLAPVVLGLQGDVVAGAGGAAGDYGKTLGLVVGMLAGMGMAYWLVRSMGLNATNTKSAWETVYAAARITQVEYLDLMDRPVPEGTPAARRRPIRRMRTWIKRAAFSDRQEVFVSASALDEKQRKKAARDSVQKRFRTGEIRLETTMDLRGVRQPHDLYEGRPLTGRWRGVNSLRWFVALKSPLETGLVALRHQTGEDLRAAARRFFVSTYGWWVLVVCVIAGLLMLFATMDYAKEQTEEQDQVPDRTPAASTTKHIRSWHDGIRNI